MSDQPEAVDGVVERRGPGEFGMRSLRAETGELRLVSDLSAAGAEIHALQAELAELRTVAVRLLFQLDIGGWVDDHGHRIERNVCFLNFAKALRSRR